MALKKIVAVVLAGGVKRFSFREFYHQLEDLFSYREWYFRVGSQSLKRVKAKRGAPGKPRPMVEYILNTLRNTECIERILVVGPEKEIREKIDPDLLSEGSNIELVQQKESFGQNVKEGYDRAGEKYVLFVTSDSPTTKEEDVSEFMEICGELYHENDLIYPLVKESLLKKYYKLFPRPFFRMIPDTIFPTDYIDEKDIREDGRAGFRITSMAFAHLEGFPVERIDEAYNLRKFYRKSSRDKLKEIFGKNVMKRYRQGLKMSEIEKMYFDYEGMRIKIVGIRGPGTSLDIDSMRDEKKFHDLDL
jgi:CTP:molybdopterin cytidylyltransferase MocA